MRHTAPLGHLVFLFTTLISLITQSDQRGDQASFGASVSGVSGVPYGLKSILNLSDKIIPDQMGEPTVPTFITLRPGHPDFLDLPWGLPLLAWPGEWLDTANIFE